MVIAQVVRAAAVVGLLLAWTVTAHATCSNYTTYTDGQVLTASSLNSLQTNYTDCVNAILNGDVFTGNMDWHSGTDARFYSDAGTTLTAQIDGATGDALLAPRADGAYGLSLVLSAGTVTVQCRNAACSTANPGFVVMSSTTAGQQVTLKVTSGGAFNDDVHASSDLTNLGFGITEAANWAQDVPFFLYVVNRGNAAIDGTDGNSHFFLARDPTLKATPSAANNIGDTVAIPVNDSENVILLLADVTVANYTSLPVQLLGAVRMQWSAANTDWTVQTLGTSDGISAQALTGTFGSTWTFPTGQNEASASTYLIANGGTAPVFGSNSYVYQLDAAGLCYVQFNLDSDGGIDGAGAVNTKLSLPYRQSVNALTVAGPIWIRYAATNDYISFMTIQALDHLGEVYRTGAALGALSAIQNSDFTNADRRVYGSFVYPAF